MSKKKQDAADHSLENIEMALSKTEQYIEDNQKSLTFIVIAIAVVIGIFLGYKKFYLAPLEEDAKSEMFGAEQYFEIDSFNLALYGDGNRMGFIDIVDEFGITKSANLANYYAGISFLNLGQYDEAIDYLKQFEADDVMLSSIAKGSIGDAYVEMDELEKAESYYKNAAEDVPNDFTSPIYLLKLGRVYESTGDYAKALNTYNTIKDNYPKSNEGTVVSKHIARVEILMQ